MVTVLVFCQILILKHLGVKNHPVTDNVTKTLMKMTMVKLLIYLLMM